MPRRTEHEAGLAPLHREPPGELALIPGVHLGVQRRQFLGTLTRLPPVEQA
ncbi:MAG: hypothetical protein ABSA93_03150 [Streptosporangiaceae bacterium]